jgi:hypothetical protein
VKLLINGKRLHNISCQFIVDCEYTIYVDDGKDASFMGLLICRKIISLMFRNSLQERAYTPVVTEKSKK